MTKISEQHHTGSGNHSHTITSKESASDEHGNLGSSCLQDDAKGENGGGGDQAKTSTNRVGNG